MTQKFEGKEKRAFLRYDHDAPLRFNRINSEKSNGTLPQLMKAMTKNLSASGLLFFADSTNVPDMSSVVALDLDYRTATICREIEDRACIVDNKLFAKVVRLEDNENGTCDVGVAFITKREPLARKIPGLLK